MKFYNTFGILSLSALSTIEYKENLILTVELLESKIKSAQIAVKWKSLVRQRI
jgi:hypothetical protein